MQFMNTMLLLISAHLFKKYALTQALDMIYDVLIFQLS